MFRYALCLIGALFLSWTAYSSLTQVRSHERAVIRRFGRVLEQKPQQGLHIGLPWGIDRVDLAPVGRVRTVTIGFSGQEDTDEDLVPIGQLLTGDHNLVNVQVSIHFKVSEKEMERYVLQQDSVDVFVARAAESLVAEWIAGRRIDDVLRRGKSELPRFLQEHMDDRLQAYGLGIEFKYASVTKLDPPDKVKEDFDKVAQAATNMDTQVNRAVEEANSMMRKADAEIKAIGRQAATYQDIEPKKAETDAANFKNRLKQYQELSRDNPAYLNTVWREEMTLLYTRMKAAGRIELLDQFMSGGELSITEFPLQPRRK
jgi:membrane protease subunit HflK